MKTRFLVLIVSSLLLFSCKSKEAKIEDLNTKIQEVNQKMNQLDVEYASAKSFYHSTGRDADSMSMVEIDMQKMNLQRTMDSLNSEIFTLQSEN